MNTKTTIGAQAPKSPPLHVGVGDVFGDLTVIALIKGAKNVHPLAVCVCSCGATRTPRQSHLRRGLAQACLRCALRRSWKSRARLDSAERLLCVKETEYRSNAKQKGRAFTLSRYSFRAMFNASCRYCGVTPSQGVDRLDSAIGYTRVNTVPCCAQCNYAKLTMSADEFLALVRRIYAHSLAGVAA